MARGGRFWGGVPPRNGQRQPDLSVTGEGRRRRHLGRLYGELLGGSGRGGAVRGCGQVSAGKETTEKTFG